jgi:multidrug efflux pump
MEVAPHYVQDAGALGSLFVGAGRGAATGGRATQEAMVPISAVGRFQTSTMPTTVFHLGQGVATPVSFNLARGHSLSDAIAAIERAIGSIRLPASVRSTLTGSAAKSQSSSGGTSGLLLIGGALAAVYFVLGVLYESYIHPLTILSTLPSAGIGAIVALMSARMELSVIALIGVILLIGIVKKNAIMMIDFALAAERSRGLTPETAIHEACLTRFRPILMTTLAALFSAVPMILDTGAGSELRRPLGISIAGGLIVSQALTLYTTPVVYLYFERLQQRMTDLRHRRYALSSPVGLRS